MYESHEIVNSGFKVDDTIKASTCDFIHSSYEPLLSNFMSDCQDALYMKEGDYCYILKKERCTEKSLIIIEMGL